MLFSKKELNPDDNCSNCQHGKASAISDDIMCTYKGPVSATGKCKKYKKNLLAVRPKKKHIFSGDFTPEDFSID
ncbi:MAG: hypothetical protein IJC89_00115 [Clostridia bacterium]|nr:hypothetical protein [Clostridia bacterium]